MSTVYAPKALSTTSLQELCAALKQALIDLYDSRLDRILLYGSYARGDFHAESDVDFMVVLRDEVVRAGWEVRQMAPLIGPLSLKYAVEVSVFPVAVQAYLSEKTLLYQAVQQESIEL